MENNTPKKRARRDRRYWRNLIVFGVVAALIMLYGIYPSILAWLELHPPRHAVGERTPADYGLDADYEDVTLTGSDGATLRGWYLPSENGAAVILVHGWSSNRAGLVPQARMLVRHGYGVLAYDARAHGDSDGDVSAWSQLDFEDVLAALAYLQAREDADADRIGAVGFSMGGYFVLHAAAQSEAIRAVLAEGPGIGVLDDAPPPENLREWLYRPGSWVFFKAWFLLAGAPEPPSLRDVLPTIAPRPLFFITAGYGEERHVRRLYEFAQEPKSLWEVLDTSHGGASAAYPEEYERRIITFFDEALRGDTASD